MPTFDKSDVCRVEQWPIPINRLTANFRIADKNVGIRLRYSH